MKEKESLSQTIEDDVRERQRQEAGNAELNRPFEEGDRERMEAAPQEQLTPKERLTREQVESALKEGSNLQNKDLSGLDLSNLSFKGINVSGSDFSGTMSRNTRYEACWMLGVDFSQAKFDGAVITHVNAAGTNWKGSQFRNTEITNSNFTRASFEGSVLEGGTIEQKQQQNHTKERLGSRFSEKMQAGRQAVRNAAQRVSEQVNLASLLSRATSRPAALLTGNNFEGANLRHARFENVGLRNNNFSGADIENALFSEQARTQNRFDPAVAPQNKDVKPERLTAEQDRAAMQSWCDSLYAVGYFHPQATARDRTRIEEQLKTVISELRDVPDYQKAQEHELYSIAARHIQGIHAIEPATPGQAVGLASEQSAPHLPDQKKRDRQRDHEPVKARSYSRR